MPHIETEVRFVNIHAPALIERAILLKAQDLGEDLLEEIIFYDTDPNNYKFVRLRKNKSGVKMTFKHHFEASASGATEIELAVDSLETAKDFCWPWAGSWNASKKKSGTPLN